MRVNLMGMEANPHPCMWICFRIQVYFNVIAHTRLYKSNNSNMFLRSVCFYFYYKPHSAFSVMVKPLHCLEYFNLWVCSVAKKKKSPLLPSLLPRNTIYSLNLGSLWTFLKIFQTILTTMISNGRLCAHSLCSGVGQFLLRERLSVSICDASVQSVTLHRKKTAINRRVYPQKLHNLWIKTSALQLLLYTSSKWCKIYKWVVSWVCHTYPNKLRARHAVGSHHSLL